MQAVGELKLGPSSQEDLIYDQTPAFMVSIDPGDQKCSLPSLASLIACR